MDMVVQKKRRWMVATVIIDRDATRACHVSAFGTAGCPGLWASFNHGENSSQLFLYRMLLSLP